MVAINPVKMPRHIAEMCERMAYDIIDKENFHVAMKINQIEMMDLVSAGLERAVVFWPKFDPSRGNQPQTPLHLAIERGMRDFIKKEESQTRRKNGLAWEMGGDQCPKEDEGRLLADWLQRVYEAAKKAYVGGRFNQGRRLHEAPQLVAIAHLMKHEGLSCRACARLLASRDDLKAVLRIKQLPSYRWIWGAAKLLEKVVTLDAQISPEVVTSNN